MQREPHVTGHLQSLRGERPDPWLEQGQRETSQRSREPGCWSWCKRSLLGSPGCAGQRGLCDAGRGPGGRRGGAAPQRQGCFHNPTGRRRYKPPLYLFPNSAEGQRCRPLTGQNRRHWLNQDAKGQGPCGESCVVWGSLLTASKGGQPQQPLDFCPSWCSSPSPLLIKRFCLSHWVSASST